MSEKDQSTEKSENIQSGKILETPITEEMKKAYLDYAMSVIVSRALPDVRDGLKPVQRRIVYAAIESKMTSTDKYRKSATLVGNVMGKYHPHGDSSIYEALVRMSQDFLLRYPLIDGQGNFGTIAGDPPAAMRYTECKLEKISEYMLKDIDKNTVDFVDNFSAEYQEPLVLPAVIPNLLMNGATGIAVGMATNIPPHNLGEIIDGINLILDTGDLNVVDTEQRIIKAYDISETTAEIAHWEVVNNVELKELVKVIKGPDFPTGCTIYDQKETLNYFATGRGRIVQRAHADIEESKSGRFQIIIKEIPYQVNLKTLIEKIADLVINKKISGVSNIIDESSGEDIRIVIELKKDANPQKVLNYLYKYTQLQSTFNVNMIALVDEEPQLLGIKAVLDYFIKHRREVITRRTLYNLRKAREREHILEGLKKALDFIDEVIAIIKKSKSTDDAREKLMKRFDLTEIQAQAILDMRLKKLSALEREKIEDELNEIRKSIDKMLLILAKPKEMIKVIKAELSEVKEKFADERMTKVIKGKIGEFSEEDLVENVETLISVTESGYIKRMKPSTYKTQGRGGKGVIGMKTKESDEVSMLRLAETHDRLFFFTDNGKVYEKRVWDIPEGSRQSKGTAVVNLLEMSTSDKLEEIIRITKEDDEDSENRYILTATRLGNIKKTKLSQYKNIRKTGIIGMKLKEGDSLVRAKLTDGNNNVILVTAKGKTIRFKESDVRDMGRSASGVRGIRLKEGDYVVSMEVVPETDDNALSILTVTAKGYAKMSAVSDYPLYKRGGSGVIGAKVTDKTGEIVGVKLITPKSQDLLLSSVSGQIIRISVKDIPKLGRSTQGVIVMRLNSGDSVAAVTVFDKPEETENQKSET